MSDEVYAMHCSLELVQSISTHQQTEAQNKKAVGTFQNKRWRPAQLIQYLRTQLPSIVTQEQIHMPSSKGCLKPQSCSRSEYQKAGKWNTTGSALLEVIKRDHSINNNFGFFDIHQIVLPEEKLFWSLWGKLQARLQALKGNVCWFAGNSFVLERLLFIPHSPQEGVTPSSNVLRY